jgi:hypothetical protein
MLDIPKDTPIIATHCLVGLAAVACGERERERERDRERGRERGRVCVLVCVCV